ncbi:hypothetical protein [Flavobacterium sp. 270]|uniref:hypothetical protein n=1 Tax=Flavobacterium sp. 270 TaxID=2512114 RepID=UPI001066995D|nr:hypothetical protein [Flavobacterium sp. 270]
MGAILSSFFLFFFLPNDIRFENDQIQIKTKFEGLLGMCCKYEVIEKKFFLFETKIGEFQNEESLYFKQNDIEIQKNKLVIHLKLKDYDVKEDHYILKNSTLEIPLRN